MNNIQNAFLTNNSELNNCKGKNKFNEDGEKD